MTSRSNSCSRHTHIHTEPLHFFHKNYSVCIWCEWDMSADNPYTHCTINICVTYRRSLSCKSDTNKWGVNVYYTSAWATFLHEPFFCSTHDKCIHKIPIFDTVQPRYTRISHSRILSIQIFDIVQAPHTNIWYSKTWLYQCLIQLL